MPALAGRITARTLLLVGALLLLGSHGADLGAAQAPDDPRVLVTTLSGTIGPVTADHLGDGVGRAERGGYEAYIVLLDTPGGLDSSTRTIVQRFLDADVPVVVYVSPRGARAASAGAFITYAAHVAAMAPGTAIGAATPVDLEGGDVEQKVINDAAALAESIARARDRDVDFAIEMVREARSASAVEALEVGAIDVVVSSVDELLEHLDGTEVELRGGRTVTLEVADAAVDTYEMGLFRRILQVLADPNLAFLFLSLGTLGIIYELASPGAGAGGVIGVILIILAMFSLAVLPVDVTGLLFLALAVALFVGELFAPGIGVFAFLGAGSLVLSGLFLFDDEPGLDVSLAVILPTALVMGLATILAGRLVWRARQAPPSTTGAGPLLGRTVVVRRVDGDEASVVVDGSWWQLRTDAPVAVGDVLRVTAVDGLTLVTEPEGSATGPPAETASPGSPIAHQKGTTHG
jgi:membrane-bound serine protease (ClpP class)